MPGLRIALLIFSNDHAGVNIASSYVNRFGGSCAGPICCRELCFGLVSRHVRQARGRAMLSGNDATAYTSWAVKNA